MTARTSFGRRWDRLNSYLCQKLAIDFRKQCPFPGSSDCAMYDWLNTGIWIEHRSPSRLFFFFSLMQLMSFVAVHIDSAFVTQEKKLSDACVCCMKRCHSLDKRRWSACITALGAARLGLWCADHHLRLGYDSIIEAWHVSNLQTEEGGTDWKSNRLKERTRERRKGGSQTIIVALTLMMNLKLLVSLYHSDTLRSIIELLVGDRLNTIAQIACRLWSRSIQLGCDFFELLTPAVSFSCPAKSSCESAALSTAPHRAYTLLTIQSNFHRSLPPEISRKMLSIHQANPYTNAMQERRFSVAGSTRLFQNYQSIYVGPCKTVMPYIILSRSCKLSHTDL